MKIKLKESQLINIVKLRIIEEEEKNVVTSVIDMWSKLRSNKFGAELLNNLLYNSDLNLDTDINPNFDPENSSPEEFTKFNILPLEDTRINSDYGPRNISGNASKDHKGLDLYAKSGTPVYSPANGRVIAAKNTGSNPCGGFIKIEHGEYVTKYCHLSKWVVSKNDPVVKGQIIGYTGGGKNDPFRGSSTGPHLHYEVLKNGTHVDPKLVHGGFS